MCGKLGRSCPVGLATSSRISRGSTAVFVLSRNFAVTYSLFGYVWVNLPKLLQNFYSGQKPWDFPLKSDCWSQNLLGSSFPASHTISTSACPAIPESWCPCVLVYQSPGAKGKHTRGGGDTHIFQDTRTNR